MTALETELLAALRDVSDRLSHRKLNEPDRIAFDKARAIIARAESQQKPTGRPYPAE